MYPVTPCLDELLTLLQINHIHLYTISQNFNTLYIYCYLSILLETIRLSCKDEYNAGKREANVNISHGALQTGSLGIR